MTSESVAVTVARHALREVGEPVLAERIEEGAGGVPLIPVRFYEGRPFTEYKDVVTRAFVLGHQALGHPAKFPDEVGTPICPCLEQLWAQGSEGGEP